MAARNQCVVLWKTTVVAISSQLLSSVGRVHSPDLGPTASWPLGALALDSYQHVVRSNEAEAGHPQISQISQIRPLRSNGREMPARGNLRDLVRQDKPGHSCNL